MAEPITNVLGVVGIKNMGEYDSNAYYEKLNVVTYQGSSYCAKQSVHGELPTNTTYWDLMVEKGEKGDTPVKGVDYYTPSDKQELINELETTLDSDVTNEVTEQLGGLASATPLAASSISEMTDTSRIYVNTSNGHWYWYNGNSWEDGGIYQSTEIADGSITEKKLNEEIMEDFNHALIIKDFSSFEKRIGTFSNPSKTEACILFPRIFFPKGTKIKFIGDINIFKWSVIICGNDFTITDSSSLHSAILDSGWLTNVDEYISDYFSYIGITLCYKSSGQTISESILDNLSDYFEIKVPYNDDKKLENIYTTIKYGELLDLNNYSVRKGTHSNENLNYAAVLRITNTIPKGSIVKFTQISGKNYKWAVIETDGLGKYHTTYKDSGFQTINNYNYVTSYDSFLFLTISSNDGSTALTNEDLENVYDAFKIYPNNQINSIEHYQNIGININDNVKSVNHRGFNSVAPENTISAYKLSKKHGFEYVETDVSFTSDNIPVLLHDNTIDRTSNGTGNISEMTFEEVRTYDFGSWKSSLYSNEKIPSFEEFILLCKNIGLKPYVELKDANNVDQNKVNILMSIAKKYGMQDKITWISFGYACLGYVKNAYPNSRLGYVMNDITSTKINEAVALKSSNNEVFIDANYNRITNELVNLCINNNLPLEIWTIDNVNEINNLNGYVTGFTSNTLKAGNILFENNID